MIERLEQQERLTSNQWKLICTANIADLLDFFDFFLIGYVTAALTKEWSLSYGQGGAILLASGLGAVPGAFIWGWLGDRIGRRTVFLWSAVTISLATGVMVFTPGPEALIPGWLFMVFFRVFVGIGNAGIFTIDLPLVQEFVPGRKRGWVSALITTLLPGGGMLAGLVASWLLPIVGWRYLFLVGLSPLVLVLMIRYWVPESPHWLIRMGRHEEARNSLAWALMIDPKEIVLPATLPAAEEKTRWLDLFKYPRLVAAGCMTGLTQTGGASFGLWGATLLVIVLNTSPAHAAFLMVFTGVSGIAGRFFITTLIEPMGRRGAGTLACGMAGLLTVSAGYFYDVFIGSWSLFYMLMLAGTFFSSSIYTVVGPYMSEIWPTRLRSSGMGMSYGVGNLGGKVLGPAGLAVIMGAGDIIKPAAPNLKMLGPAFVYFACWYIIGIIGFWVFGPETKGRTFEEMDEAHNAPLVAAAAGRSTRVPAE
jgi:MFS transporter, putative metabolite:H+ symporter